MTRHESEEELVRSALALLVDTTPPGREFDELFDATLTTNRRSVSPAMAFGAAFVAVAIAGAILASIINRGPEATPPQDVAGEVPADPIDELDPDTIDPAILDFIPERPERRTFSSQNPPTFEEYEQAALWTLSCMESLGAPGAFAGLDSDISLLHMPVVGIPANKIYVWGVRTEVEPDSPVATGEMAESICRGLISFDDISFLYTDSATDTDKEAWIANLRSCLVAEGAGYADEIVDEVTFGTYVDSVPSQCFP